MFTQRWKQIRAILQTHRVHRLAVLVALLLAAGLRLNALGGQSLWNDEGASFAMTQRTVSAILTNTAADIHPPGYYLLLAGWVRLAGASELALRLPSALASLLTVAITYAIGRRLFGRDAGLIAALLLSINTFSIYYAQEARMYALLALLAAAGMGALVLWLTTAGRARAGLRPPGGDAGYAAALALTNAAGLYTQYAYPVMMLVQGLVFLLWWWRRWRRRELFARILGLYVAANGITLLLFAPWIGTAIRQVTTWPRGGVSLGLLEMLDAALFGLARTGQGLAGAGALGAAIFAALGLAYARQDRAALIPVLWLAAPLGVFVALGLAPDDLKSLLPVAAAAALWIGLGMAALIRAWCLQNAVIALLGAAAMAPAYTGGLDLLYNSVEYRRDDYRTMAARVQDIHRPGDAVILNGPGQGEVWAYYDDGSAPVYPLPRGLGGDDDATRAELGSIMQTHRRLFVLFWGEGERDPNRVVEATLDSRAFEASTAWYGDVRFVIYAVPGEAATAPTVRLNRRFGEHIMLQGYALDASSYRPGDALTLTLFWQTDAQLERRYKVFVHVYGDLNAPPLAQRDSEPGGGLTPTIDWLRGETVIDRHGTLLPPDLLPGDYTVMIGLYDADDPAARLATGSGDRLPLGTITVTR